LASSPATEPATTTARSISQDVAKAVDSAFNLLFETAASGGDTSGLVNALSPVATQLNESPHLVGAYAQSLVFQITTAVQNPNEEQKAKIIEGVIQSKTAIDNMIRWHPGMENYDSDPKLLADPQLTDFYQMIQSYQKNIAKIVSDPSTAYDFYVSDPTFRERLSQGLMIINNAGKAALKYTSKDSLEIKSNLSASSTTLAPAPVSSVKAPDTTLSFFQQAEKTIASSFNQMFAAVATGSDVSFIVAGISAIAGQLGINGQAVGSYMGALVDLAKAAVPNPTEEQKAKVIAGVTAVRAAFSNLVKSNSRMQNWETDVTLTDNPEFADFYQMAY
jgi:phenylpyruvate tautomerase PptA (4-oxalocrotonate tautomerase family)